MTPAGLAVMQQASAEAAEYLGAALSTMADAPEGAPTPVQLALAHGNARSYLQLAEAAIDRFEEAARG